VKSPVKRKREEKDEEEPTKAATPAKSPPKKLLERKEKEQAKEEDEVALDDLDKELLPTGPGLRPFISLSLTPSTRRLLDFFLKIHHFTIIFSLYFQLFAILRPFPIDRSPSFSRHFSFPFFLSNKLLILCFQLRSASF